jgi:trehalose 6-phosphate phosphatase
VGRGSPAAAGRATRLAAALRTAVAALPGVWVERKGPLVALHLRPAAPAVRRRGWTVAVRLRPRGYALIEGRRVVELRPVRGPTKGDAVAWIAARRPGATVLYVGDDVTDEDAFGVLGRGDFAVLVGGARARAEHPRAHLPTRARHRLSGPPAVARLLARLARGR